MNASYNRGSVLHRYFLHNETLHEASAQVLSPGQVGLLSGWGVFSTLKIAGGIPFAFERHWARLQRDAAKLHVPLPAGAGGVRRRLLELIEANGARNATLRVVVVRNLGGMWQGPSTGRASDLIALTADTKDWGHGVKLCPVGQARHASSPFAGVKSLSWAMNLTWLEEAQAQGFDEAILLNERGEVAECTSANIFAAVGNEVWTPPLSSGCLPGVTREILLGEIHAPGISFVEKTLHVEDLIRADDVFITSTTRDLLPVLRIGGHEIHARSDVRQRLQQGFSRYVAAYIEKALAALA